MGHADLKTMQGYLMTSEEEVIKQRLFTYEKNEEEIVKFFSKATRSFFELNVEKHLPDIFDEFKNIITLKYDNN